MENDRYFESKWNEYRIIPILLMQANKLTELHPERERTLGNAVRLYRQLRIEDINNGLWKTYQKEYPNTLNDLHWWNQIFAQE